MSLLQQRYSVLYADSDQIRRRAFHQFLQMLQMCETVERLMNARSRISYNIPMMLHSKTFVGFEYLSHHEHALIRCGLVFPPSYIRWSDGEGSDSYSTSRHLRSFRAICISWRYFLLSNFEHHTSFSQPKLWSGKFFCSVSDCNLRILYLLEIRQILATHG